MLSSIQEKAAAVAAAPSTEIPQQEEYSVSSEQQCSMLTAGMQTLTHMPFSV